MARSDIYIKIVVDHDDRESVEKLAEEISRRIEKLYGVRSAEINSVIRQSTGPDSSS